MLYNMDTIIDDWVIQMKILDNAEYDYEYLSMDEKEYPEVQEQLKCITNAENRARKIIKNKIITLSQNEVDNVLDKYTKLFEEATNNYNTINVVEVEHSKIAIAYASMIEKKQILTMLQDKQ